MKVHRTSSPFSRLLLAPRHQTGRIRVYFWLVLTSATILASQPLNATLILTYAGSTTAVNSTISDTAVIDFNALTTSGAGAYSNVTWTDPTLGNIGTIDQVYMQYANQYGAANYTVGTSPTGYYPVQSDPPNGVGYSQAIPVTTLTLSTPSAYFGLWWSAGDAHNVLTFYNGNDPIAQYSTTTLPGLLPDSYFGNPQNYRHDSGEPFAFLNFYAVQGEQFTKVVLSNNSTATGFESDNWTVRAKAYGYYPGEDPQNLPGVLVGTVPVPEPSTTTALGLSALVIAGALASRRRV